MSMSSRRFAHLCAAVRCFVSPLWFRSADLSAVDTDVLTFRYPDLFTLMDHLQGMGENNAVRLRPAAVSRDVFLAAAATYEVRFFCACTPRRNTRACKTRRAMVCTQLPSLITRCLFFCAPCLSVCGQSLYADDDGLLPATFQVFYMIGWAPHVSQPKPLERGSATSKLADLANLTSTQQQQTSTATPEEEPTKFVEQSSS